MRAISPRARLLRTDMTDAERIIWQKVRNRQLAGCKFRRQWTIGRFVTDFCCIERRLVIEIDGGQHDVSKDAARTRQIEMLGYHVIRFWNHEVMTNIEGVLAAIVEALTPHPHPVPLPRAGEGA